MLRRIFDAPPLRNPRLEHFCFKCTHFPSPAHGRGVGERGRETVPTAPLPTLTRHLLPKREKAVVPKKNPRLVAFNHTYRSPNQHTLAEDGTSQSNGNQPSAHA